MTKIVEQVGSEADVQNLYTGPARQITVDTSNWNLRLHDGATPGGRTILNRDNADVRYQAREPELDGLSAFDPFLRGYLVRVGPGEYQLRSILVDTANLAVTESAAFGGDTVLSLAATITSAHQWTATQLFSGGIIASEFDGPLRGNVTGNVAGDTTGTHTGPTIGGLTGDSTGTHNGPTVGDVDVRGAALRLDAGQIHLAALNADVSTFIETYMPRGVIVLWSGLIVDIPTGWLLCDGTAGTPDLRDRFIVGAGLTYLEDDTGGADSYAAAGVAEDTGHNHDVTVAGTVLNVSQLPPHEHGNGVADDTSGFQRMWRGTTAISVSGGSSIKDGGGLSGAIEGLSETVGGGVSHTHAAVTALHSAEYPVTIPSQSYLPPYYALAYIKKGF